VLLGDVDFDDLLKERVELGFWSRVEFVQFFEHKKSFLFYLA
jgi:hypothetical protein